MWFVVMGRDPPAALTQPADGQGEEKMEEEVVCGRTRGAQQACCSQGGRAWERQPPEQSQFCYTGRTDSEETGLCPLHFQSQEFWGEKCLLVIHSARNNTQSSSAPL